MKNTISNKEILKNVCFYISRILFNIVNLQRLRINLTKAFKNRIDLIFRFLYKCFESKSSAGFFNTFLSIQILIRKENYILPFYSSK